MGCRSRARLRRQIRLWPARRKRLYPPSLPQPPAAPTTTFAQQRSPWQRSLREQTPSNAVQRSAAIDCPRLSASRTTSSFLIAGAAASRSGSPRAPRQQLPQDPLAGWLPTSRPTFRRQGHTKPRYLSLVPSGNEAFDSPSLLTGSGRTPRRRCRQTLTTSPADNIAQGRSLPPSRQPPAGNVQVASCARPPDTPARSPSSAPHPASACRAPSLGPGPGGA